MRDVEGGGTGTRVDGDPETRRPGDVSERTSISGEEWWEGVSWFTGTKRKSRVGQSRRSYGRSERRFRR